MGSKKLKQKKYLIAKMINLIGDDITVYRNKKFKDNEFFFDYSKKRDQRKKKDGSFNYSRNIDKYIIIIFK